MTVRLILLFALGVVGIIVALYAALVVIIHYAYSDGTVGGVQFGWFNPTLFLVVALTALAVIIGGSLIKIHALRRGGPYVAESLGGRAVNPATNDPRERILVNVVEEMAIASGVPVPVIYVLDSEAGINAFAAGYTFDDAVVGVTRGCLEQLNRDELQGVVAHEFSHILNGDMRLNIRLIGLISGILVLAVIGRILLRSGRGGSRGKGSGPMAMMGIAMLMTGYIGVLVSRIIQSAVSRQREYLSDASAVQFTRNPTGIANALKKIGGFSAGTTIESPMAAETGHMFFGSAYSAIFSTHPPIIERIRRIDPGFSGDFSDRNPAKHRFQGDADSPVSAAMPGIGERTAPAGIMRRVGTVTVENIASCAKMLEAMPSRLRDDLRDPFGASCVIYAMLLDEDEAERKKQLRILLSMVSDETAEKVLRLEKDIAVLSREMILALLDLSLPALRNLSAPQYDRFKQHVHALVQADGKMSLFEFIIQQIIVHRLDAAFHPREEKETYRSIEPLMEETVAVLSKLAATGHKSPEEARKAFESAMHKVPLSGIGEERHMVDVSLEDVGRALSKFASSRPGVRQILLNACAHCVLYDSNVTVSEAELLRAVAYAIDLPLPPAARDSIGR